MAMTGAAQVPPRDRWTLGPIPEAPPATAARGLGIWYVRLFALAIFFPYPALSIGNNSGLQLGEAMALLATLALVHRPPCRSFHVMVVIVTTMMVSNFLNLMRYVPPRPDGMPKEAISYAVALWPLWPSTFLAARGRFRDALVAASLATLTHAAVGAYQMYAFTKNEFPLLWLYRNPSFMPMSSWAESYATYMKRPCGLFPEPSAMGAALGPWLVILACQSLLPSPALGLSRRDRRLFLIASVAGLALLGLSRSGSSVATVGALLLVLAAKVGPVLRAYGNAGVVALAGVVILAVGSAGYMVTQVGGDLDSRIESSWGLRGRSIYEALTVNASSIAFFTGLGAGQAEVKIQELMADVPLSGGAEKVAVWSLVANYYMEHGLLGAFAMAVTFGMTVRGVRRSSEVALGAGALLAWLVGVTVTTSYLHIISIWVFLGALLEWDKIFPPAKSIQGGAS
ncbi:MAG: hypothetical protein AB7I30_03295 [Isosphaeraceae bacterium]